MLRIILICLSLLGLAACTGVPKNVDPVKPVSVERYTGTWYEIARMDHSFERGLSQVTATYTLRDDGGINVLNRGYNAEKSEWKQAEGKAYFVDDKNVGHLKVSFFGPFYASYVIFGLDRQDYQWSFVTSYNAEYVWLLARSPTVSDELKQRFVQEAKAIGVNTDELIWVEQ